MVAFPKPTAVESVNLDAIQQAVLALLQSSAFAPFYSENFSGAVVVTERWNYDGNRLILSVYIGLHDACYPKTGEAMERLYQSQLHPIIEAVLALPLIQSAHRIQDYAFIEVLFRTATQMNDLIRQNQ
jgi:hypothetical protein